MEKPANNRTGMEDPAAKKGVKPPATRKERLAGALRANLARRKAAENKNGK